MQLCKECLKLKLNTAATDFPHTNYTWNWRPVVCFSFQSPPCFHWYWTTTAECIGEWRWKCPKSIQHQTFSNVQHNGPCLSNPEYRPDISQIHIKKQLFSESIDAVTDKTVKNRWADWMLGLRTVLCCRPPTHFLFLPFCVLFTKQKVFTVHRVYNRGRKISVKFLHNISKFRQKFV